MGKKRKFHLPGVLAYPNTLFVVAGSLAGLAIILCMEPKEDTFQPAYEERVSLTSHWEENETVVLAGTVEEPEDLTVAVPELTGTPEQEDAPDLPEGETGKQEEPDVTEASEEVLEEPEEQAGMEQPKDLKQPEETGPPVETNQPEDSGTEGTGTEDPGMEDTDALPDRDVTPDEKENEPEEEIRFAENTTKKDMENTKPTDKPEPPADTKNPDKKPEYDEDVPVAGKPEDATAGKVYDPVFGWITTGEAVSDEVDNDGSLEKQVGTMGN